MKQINRNSIALTLFIILFARLSLHAQFSSNIDFIFLIDVSGSMEFSLDALNTSGPGGIPPGPGDECYPGANPNPNTLTTDATYYAGASWQRLWYVRQSLPVIGKIIENILPIPPHNVSQKRFAFGIFPGADYTIGNADPILLKGSSETNNQLRTWYESHYRNILGLSSSGSDDLCAASTCLPPNQVIPRWNGTPIGSALQLALDTWNADNNPPPAAETDSIIFILTDGSLHGGLPVPSAADMRNIKVLSLGFGKRGESEVDYNFLETQVSRNSQYVRAFETHPSPGSTTKSLTSTNVSLLFSALNYPIIADPVFELTYNTVKQIDIEVTEFDFQIYFLLSWYNPIDSNKADFSLQTPNSANNIITPQIAAENDAISYYEGTTYKMYVINPTFLYKNVGTWSLIIDGSTLKPGTKQLVDYLVGGYSDLRVDVNKNSSSGVVYTGDNLDYVYQASAKNQVLPDVMMTIEFSRPSLSVANWLAKNKLSCSEREFVKNLQFAGDVTDAFKKSYYLRTYKKIDLPSDIIETKRLFDDGKNADWEKKDGISGIQIKNISKPGVYCSRLSASRTTSNNKKFSRELFQTHVVEPKIEANWKSSIFKSFMVSRTDKIITYEVQFTPRDQFGNYLMPGQASYIEFEASGESQAIGDILDDLEGSYSKIIVVPAHAPQPYITVHYKNITFPPIQLGTTSKCLKFSMTPLLGKIDFNNKLGLEKNFSYRFRLSCTQSGNLRFNSEFGYTPTADKNKNTGFMFDIGIGASYDLCNLNLKKLGDVIPYLSADIGWLTLKEFTTSDEDFFVNMGVGFKYKFHDRLYIFVELKDFLIFNAFNQEETNNLLIDAGLNIKLTKICW